MPNLSRSGSARVGVAVEGWTLCPDQCGGETRGKEGGFFNLLVGLWSVLTIPFLVSETVARSVFRDEDIPELRTSGVAREASPVSTHRVTNRVLSPVNLDE